MSGIRTRAVRYDRDTHRIQRGDDVVALAQRLSSDRWSLCDTNDVRIGRRTYATPKEVATAFDEIGSGGSAT